MKTQLSLIFWSIVIVLCYLVLESLCIWLTIQHTEVIILPIFIGIGGAIAIGTTIGSEWHKFFKGGR